MRMVVVLAFLLSCLGCRLPDPRSTTPSDLPLSAEPAETPTAPPQEPAAPESLNAEANQSSTSSPEEDCLGLAATCIQKGDSATAAGHLKRHLAAHPDQLMIRAYLAEILFKLQRYADAQDHFEQFVADAQDSAGPPRKHIIHCHTRLMEIAQERKDDYGEHLHRGIGFVLLARQLDSMLASEAEPGFRERLLCKASQELTKAYQLRRDEPRPSWYLFEVWTKLDQPRSAEKALKKTKSLALLSPLPPSEQRALALAVR
jgi:tetratricopeptide (TPR) repeat protein